jgi:hypothetical protein
MNSEMEGDSIKESTTLFPPYRELVRIAQQWEYGSFHTHQEIAGILGIDYGTPDYYQNVSWVLEEMRGLGKRLRCEHTKGYRVLKPGEYPEAAYDDTKRAARVLKNGLDGVHTAPVQKMDQPTQRKMEHIGVHLARTYVSVVNAAAEVKELAGIKRPQKMLSKGANNNSQKVD